MPSLEQEFNKKYVDWCKTQGISPQWGEDYGERNGLVMPRHFNCRSYLPPQSHYCEMHLGKHMLTTLVAFALIAGSIAAAVGVVKGLDKAVDMYEKAREQEWYPSH